MKPGLGIRALTVLIAFFFIAPTVVVIGASFTPSRLVEFPPSGFSMQWYEEVFADPQWTDAFVNSVQTGIIAAVLAAVAGTLLALMVARGRGVPRRFVSTLATVPLVVPSVVVALSIYLLYVKIGLTGNALGLGVAHAALGIPFVFVNVLAQLTTLDSRLEDAARACGAGEVKTFLFVTLPLIMTGTLTGALLAFITSWDEVVVAVFLATPDFHTVPIEIFGELREGVQPSTAAVAAIVTAVSLLILAVISLVAPLRKLRAGARRRRFAA